MPSYGTIRPLPEFFPVYSSGLHGHHDAIDELLIEPTLAVLSIGINLQHDGHIYT
jgi:hypothetical protein